MFFLKGRKYEGKNSKNIIIIINSKTIKGTSFAQHHQMMLRNLTNSEESDAHSKSVGRHSCDNCDSEGRSSIEEDERNRLYTISDFIHNIYDRLGNCNFPSSFESDIYTDHQQTGNDVNSEKLSTSIIDHVFCSYTPQNLNGFTLEELLLAKKNLQVKLNQISLVLVKHLKTRDRALKRRRNLCEIITAMLQAATDKKSEDAKISFSLGNVGQMTEGEFVRWKDALRVMCRIGEGIPNELRATIWVELVKRKLPDSKFQEIIDVCFSEKMTPYDEELGVQIIKDLHRTGQICSVTENDRAALQRVLLGYARWNAKIGYCQGFNVIAAFLLRVVNGREKDALLIMIYLIDILLPDGYYANTMRALAVDLAVLKRLLRHRLPSLSCHLDQLQRESSQSFLQPFATSTSVNQQQNTIVKRYEPPLINAFAIQWFLTLFATALSTETTLRVWDMVLIDGSHILLGVACAIWGHLESALLQTKTSNDFYMLMGKLTNEIANGRILKTNELLPIICRQSSIYRHYTRQLREYYSCNIITSSSSSSSSSTVHHNNSQHHQYGNVEDKLKSANNKRRSFPFKSSKKKDDFDIYSTLSDHTIDSSIGKKHSIDQIIDSSFNGDNDLADELIEERRQSFLQQIPFRSEKTVTSTMTSPNRSNSIAVTSVSSHSPKSPLCNSPLFDDGDKVTESNQNYSEDHDNNIQNQSSKLFFQHLFPSNIFKNNRSNSFHVPSSLPETSPTNKPVPSFADNMTTDMNKLRQNYKQIKKRHATSKLGFPSNTIIASTSPNRVSNHLLLKMNQNNQNEQLPNILYGIVRTVQQLPNRKMKNISK
ncbi:hypothetical protein SNEBB_009656 [Seison nebaliae]|nr:hypothetical protein SNEBB_009656 [Seison nebaliae]